MLKVKFLLPVWLAFVCAYSSAPGWSADAVISPADTSVTAGKVEETLAAKRALIKQLIQLTEADKNSAAMVDVMVKQQEAQTPRLVAAAVAQSNLTGQEAEDLKRKLIAYRQSFLDRFRVLFTEQVSMADITNKIFYTLYEKYFSAGELKDLVDFYRSPTGQKSAHLMPRLMQDAMQSFGQELGAIANKVEQQVQEERKAGKLPVPGQ